MSASDLVPSLQTKIQNFNTTVDTKKSTIDAKNTTSQTALTTALSNRQSTIDASNTAKASLDQAYDNTRSILANTTQQDLSEIIATKTDNAVDIFIYDTSKDSDGGAWRHRCTKTSWYREPLNTAKRGARRAFPAVAVLVATGGSAATVTIYDGDDPSLPMWMVTDWNVNIEELCVTARNGIVATGSRHSNENYAGNGFALMDFPNSRLRRSLKNSSSAAPWSSILDGFTSGSISEGVGAIHSREFELTDFRVNDVALTVLPDAPIDPATGLPVPTIAVATDGGVSVIKDDGTVVDSTISSVSSSVGWAGVSLFFDAKRTPNPLCYVEDIRSVSDGFSHNRNWQRWISGATAPVIGYSNREFRPVSDGKTDHFGLGGEVPGLFHLVRGNGDLTARITSSHVTGWMPGDIRGAFLADTDDADLVGSGDLANISSPDSTDAGTYTDNGDGTYTYEPDAGQSRPNVTWGSLISIYKRYVISVKVAPTSSSCRISAGSNLLATNLQNKGQLAFTFDGQTNVRIASENTNTDGTEQIIIEKIEIYEADADRSVNSNGLVIIGTVNRTPVATGSDLVAYSGFSAGNYLEQPYNPDLDFGTGDFCVMGWFNFRGGLERAFHRGKKISIINNNDPITAIIGSTALTHPQVTNQWLFLVSTRLGGVGYFYVNGELSNSAPASDNLDDATAEVNIGHLAGGANYPLDGSLALLRIGATTPTPEQIKRIYEDEKVLFQPNSACTLYGTSDKVSALAHDPDTDLLHVGTSAGRSVFKGLRRVENTTTAITTAISAQNGMVIEQ